MKVCIIQPEYSMDFRDNEKCFENMLRLMDECDSSADIIVLPEYCDIPSASSCAVEFNGSMDALNERAKKACSELAVRTGALVFANMGDKTDVGYRNTTFAFDEKGKVIGKYYKAHPAPSELKTAEQGGNGMDCSYADGFSPVYTLTAKGYKFAFMTCYDFYFYENFSQIAREKPDFIIGCSHQRTDPHAMLEIINRFLSLNTNAYLLRSAVSMGEVSAVCGSSMVVAPSGEVLLDMKNEVGVGVCEIDPSKKFYKPAGFGGAKKSHFEYTEEGRRPWLYRPSGSMMIKSEKTLPYPRICAHRGFSAVAPENSMPALGAAVALGVDEIEFDIYDTKDGEIVAIHDSLLDRVSTGSGRVWDYTYNELLAFDFGIRTGEHFAGLKIARFEDILKKFACTVIMNIHVKIWDVGRPLPMYEKISGLIHKYNCEKHCYVMSTNDNALAEFHRAAPDIARCVGYDDVEDDMLRMPRRALALGCEKIQLFKPHFDQTTVDFAKKNGIRCNVFWADDPDEAKRYIDMGIDCVLTNDCIKMINTLKHQQ